MLTLTLDLNMKNKWKEKSEQKIKELKSTIFNSNSVRLKAKNIYKCYLTSFSNYSSIKHIVIDNLVKRPLSLA